MTEEDRQAVLISLRQRLESLRRAGLDRIPVAWDVIPRERASVRSPAPSATSDLGRPTIPRSTPPPPVARPETPAAAQIPRKPEIGPQERASSATRFLASTGSLFGESGFAEPEVPVEQRLTVLDAQRQEVAGCTRCPHLAASRTQTVFGVGNPNARLMFIGEAPGADEDRLGEPFVGRAGQLLTDMITKGMGLRREDVYIANILKCRPPGNRDPEPGEIANCIGYLERQIATVRPEYLCLLGRIAAQALLDTAMPLGRLRGKWTRYRDIPTLVTYHPSYLLRNPASKADAWEDLKMLMRALGLKIPERKKPRGDT